MAARKGRSVTLRWNNQIVPGVREKGVTLNGEPVDVTSDENDGWRTLLTDNGPAENQVDISLSGVTKSDALKRDWFDNNRTRAVEVEYPDGSVLAGQFYLASFEETEPYNEATTFTATLQSSGPVTFTPYS